MPTLTGLSATQPPLLTRVGCATSHHQTKKVILFVCLFTVAFISATMWVFSSLIPHGMHLVVPTHPYLFWVVCHPSRTFLLKEPEREPQNRLSPLPTARPYLLLPLTYDPPLLVLGGYRLVIFKPCACSTPQYFQNLSAAYAFAWSGDSSVHSTAHP